MLIFNHFFVNLQLKKMLPVWIPNELKIDLSYLSWKFSWHLLKNWQNFLKQFFFMRKKHIQKCHCAALCKICIDWKLTISWKLRLYFIGIQHFFFTHRYKTNWKGLSILRQLFNDYFNVGYTVFKCSFTACSMGNNAWIIARLV